MLETPFLQYDEGPRGSYDLVALFVNHISNKFPHS